MDDINAHIARSGNTHESIHIRPVHINKAASRVDCVADLLDVPLKNADRIRICKHQSSHAPLIAEFPKVRHVRQSLGSRADGFDREAGHCC